MALEEGPRLVGKVDVLIGLADLPPQTAPHLHRVWPPMAHAAGVVEPKFATAVGPRIMFPFDDAGGEARFSGVRISGDGVGDSVYLGWALKLQHREPGVSRRFHTGGQRRVAALLSPQAGTR